LKPFQFLRYLALEVGVARDQIFINLGELTGNIWTTSLR
jgi:hypothetical protein